jgi:molybdate transport repressor ModE-like protein
LTWNTVSSPLLVNVITRKGGVLLIAMSKPQPAFKLWMETDEGYVFGPGVYRLLKTIHKTGTLKEASQELGMSYRYAWGLIKKAEAKLGEPLIEASKGGRLGGGSSVITDLGTSFIDDFEQIQAQWKDFVSSQKIEIEGEITHVREIEGGYEITVESNHSGLKQGDSVKVSLT